MPTFITTGVNGPIVISVPVPADLNETIRCPFGNIVNIMRRIFLFTCDCEQDETDNKEQNRRFNHIHLLTEIPAKRILLNQGKFQAESEICI